MVAEGKANSNPTAGKPKKRKYLPQNRPVRKGSYPLRPGVQGFFITCDGGRERQAINEALNLLDNVYEEIVDGKDSTRKSTIIPDKPLNKITKFEDPNSSGSDDDSAHRAEDQSTETHEDNKEASLSKRQRTLPDSPNGQDSSNVSVEDEKVDFSAIKQNGESLTNTCVVSDISKEKSVDELIDEELNELNDKNKRRFFSLESGCNGVIFIQMRKKMEDPSPSTIAEHLLNSAASSRKHLSRFILRILPVEVTCYPSEEEITKAIKPLISEHFPTEGATPQKFAVLYEARANTGVERMKIINAVAKVVPPPHKVDLNNPDKTIIVQIAKTICSIGVARRYKELSKYNLRQLTCPQV